MSDINTEIMKVKINNKLDILIAIELLWCRVFDGWACPKCGVIQGEPRKGINKYYCKHQGRDLDKFLLPIKKRLTKEVTISVLHIVPQLSKQRIRDIIEKLKEVEEK